MHTPNFTAFLTTKKQVYKVAKKLGFTQTRGASAGEGSPREMLEAIGSGNALVVNLADDLEYGLVDDLNKLAETQRPMLADLLRRIALSLEMAEKLNR